MQSIILIVFLPLLAALVTGVWWLSQRPMFALGSVTVESMYGIDLKHVNELTVRNGVVLDNTPRVLPPVAQRDRL